MTDSRLISEAVKEEARRLYVPGVFGTYRVARELGIGPSSVLRIVNPEIEERSRANARAYKQRQRGVCVDCGTETKYGGGATRVGVRCRECEYDHRLKWTRERVIAAIQEWARRTGKPPTAPQWRRAQVAEDGYEFPSAAAVYTPSVRDRLFPNWADAIEAAGFPRPRVGGYERTPEIRRKYSEARRRRAA